MDMPHSLAVEDLAVWIDGIRTPDWGTASWTNKLKLAAAVRSLIEEKVREAVKAGHVCGAPYDEIVARILGATA